MLFLPYVHASVRAISSAACADKCTGIEKKALAKSITEKYLHSGFI